MWRSSLCDIACLVDDWNGTVAGVFDDLTFRDVNESRTVAMTVPRHNAARLDSELAQSQLPSCELHRLFFQVDCGENCIRNPFRSVRDGLAYVSLELIGRALTGEHRRGGGERRASHYACQNKAAADASAGCLEIGHFDISSVTPRPMRPFAVRRIKRMHL